MILCVGYNYAVYDVNLLYLNIVVLSFFYFSIFIDILMCLMVRIVLTCSSCSDIIINLSI